VPSRRRNRGQRRGKPDPGVRDGTRALAKNHAIRIERESIAAAEARMTGASGAYDPQLKLELTARHHRDPITSIFSGAPSGHIAATDDSFASSVSVSQLFRTGAMASLTTFASREGNNSALNLFQPAYLTSLASNCGSW
jgi:outer membrane protein TolC